MVEKPFVIGVFVSSPSVDHYIKKIASREDHIIRISYGSLEDAIPSGKIMEEEGVEVVVSRRGAACLLRENLHIPVLSLPQSSLNVLSSIRTATRKGKKIFLPSFRDKRGGLEVIGELLHIDFGQGTYTDSQSLRQLLAKAAEDGFDTVIGGNATMRYAAEFGLNYSELVSSEDEVVEAIDNAKSVARSQRERRAAAQRYQTIMDAASDGIVAVDLEGNITTINQAARDMLKVKQNNILGLPFKRLLPQANLVRVIQNKKPVWDKVEKIDEELFVFNHIPVMLGEEIIGLVSSFKEAAHVIRTENKVRRSMTKGFVARYVIEDLIYKDSAMAKVVNSCREFAKTDSSILITGETGTGKEVLAQSIHNLSRRKTRPFVSIHCAALPEQLLESELFGYEEGAFTGSKKGGKPGLFELAHQGTLFLDEIDSTSQNVQLRLLRVLQEREVMRVGAVNQVPVDVRVIAAAGKDLWDAVQRGSFRKDLFFRLNVLRISIPPLWARKEDISLLLQHFLAYYATKYNLAPPTLPPSYLDALTQYSWPGNIRQIKHFAEQLLLNCNFQCADDTLATLFTELTQIVETEKQPRQEPAINSPTMASIPIVHREVNAEALRSALQQARFNRTKAAEILGIGRTTLWRKLKEFNME